MARVAIVTIFVVVLQIVFGKDFEISFLKYNFLFTSTKSIIKYPTIVIHFIFLKLVQ